MKNNRGQVLVVFVLLLPILILIMAALVEIGDLLVYQNKLETNAKYIITYGVENIEDTDLNSKLQTLNDKNLNSKAKMSITNESITLSIKQKKQNVFAFLKIPLTVEFTYKGTLQDGKVKIIKE